MADFQKMPYNSYLIDNELYIGVSTVLNIESPGDFLLPWALRTFSKAPDPLAAHRSYMESVSGTGTRIHRYIEEDLAGRSEEAKQFAGEDTIDAIEAFHYWKKNHKIKVLASEKTVHHSGWRCAGTLDGVLEIDDKLYVIDWKSGKFKARYFSQLAAYKSMLLQESKKSRIKGIETAELAVIEVNRDGSPIKLITLADKYSGAITEDDELGVFNALRYVWYLRNFKSKQYNPVIKYMEQLLDPMDEAFQKTFRMKLEVQEEPSKTKRANA